MNCLDCNKEISKERLLAVPDTQYCIACVDRHTPQSIARMIYNHKTAGEVIIARGRENIRRLNREYSRGR